MPAPWPANPARGQYICIVADGGAFGVTMLLEDFSMLTAFPCLNATVGR